MTSVYKVKRFSMIEKKLAKTVQNQIRSATPSPNRILAEKSRDTARELSNVTGKRTSSHLVGDSIVISNFYGNARNKTVKPSPGPTLPGILDGIPKFSKKINKNRVKRIPPLNPKIRGTERKPLIINNKPAESIEHLDTTGAKKSGGIQYTIDF